MSVPVNLDEIVSSLCSTGLRPHIITGIILKLLTQHFSSSKNIQEPTLKDYIWNFDPKMSKILITPVWKWLTIKAESRPAIIIKRNSLKTRQLGLADGQALVQNDLNNRVIPAEGVGVSQIAVTGSHSIFCLSPAPAEAELLATEVFSRLVQYQQAIQKEFLFNRFRVGELGEVSKIEEASEYFGVPVNIVYAYIDAWEVWTEAPFLKRIAVQANIK